MTAPRETLSAYASNYKLPRNESKNLRLSAQHYVFTQRQGWLLHPKIQEAISGVEKPQIADVACGSGIWGFEVADKIPTSFVTGLDISDAQFPPRWIWPGNCVLDILDLTKPVPSKHQAKYDVVHCRLLLAPGPVIDPRVWVKSFEQLLRPGGWLQWEELPDSLFGSIEPFKDAAEKASYRFTPLLVPMTAKIIGYEYKCMWFCDFENWMGNNSTLQELEQVDIPVHPPTAKIENDLVRRVTVDISGRMLQITDLDDFTKEKIWEECVDQFEKVQAEGNLVGFKWIVGLAKAP